MDFMEEMERVVFVFCQEGEFRERKETFYSGKEVNQLLQDFQKIKCGEAYCRVKKVGIQLNEETIYFLKQRVGQEFPVLLSAPKGTKEEILYQLDRYKTYFYQLLLQKEQEEEKEKLFKKFEAFSSPISARQKKFNFKKEILKRQKSVSIYRNCDFRYYDFRACKKLQESLFICCDLRNCNFSHVNLTNTIFIDCKLEGAVFYQAVLNGVKAFENGKVEDVAFDNFH